MSANRTHMALLIPVLLLVVVPVTGQNAGPNGKSVNKVAVTPTNPSTVIAQSGGVPFRSTNGGASWTEIPGDFTVLKADLVDPRVLYRGKSATFIDSPTFFKSTDSGSLWQYSISGLTYANSFAHFTAYSINALAIDPKTPTTLYAAIATGPPYASVGFRKSTDAGTTWRPLSNVPVNGPFTVNSLVIDPTNSSILYIGTGHSVFKSIDGGQHWLSSSAGLPDAIVGPLVIDPSNPMTLYAGTGGDNTGLTVPGGGLRPGEGRGVFKSIDAGQSWLSATAGLPPNSLVKALVMDPSDVATLYAVTQDGIFRTTDRGASWSFSSDGLRAVNDIAIDPNAPSTMYAGTNTGVFKSSDRGATWSPSGLILDTPPFLSGLSPNSAVRTATVPVALSGRNFVSPITANVGPGITIKSVSVTSAFSATVILTIDGTVIPGLRQITVSNSEGTSNALDFTVTPQTKQSDFNGDGKSDLLLYNSTTGQTSLLQMNGANVVGRTDLLSHPEWKVTAVADFNGDGHSDLLWYNPTTGETVMWLMNGSQILSWASLLTSSEWSVTNAVDLNDDGRADLLWSSAISGEIVEWRMDGTQLLSWESLNAIPGPFKTIPSLALKVTMTADVSGDGAPDLIVFDSSTGATSVWRILGTTSHTTLLTDPNWRVTHTGDLDGDGQADLIWYNAASHETMVWLMDFLAQRKAARSLLTDSDRRVVAVADFDADGKSDLLWYSAATGETSLWMMDGTNVLSHSVLLTDPYWRVIATADFNGDGKADLLWNYPPTGENVIWLVNGASPSSYGLAFVDSRTTVTTK